MISNRRIYANPNSAETAIFEHELEEAGIQFLRHDPGVTLGYAPSSFLVQSVVYTFFEEDFDRAQAIFDKVKQNMG